MTRLDYILATEPSRIASQTLDSDFDEVSYSDVFAELPSKPEAAEGWEAPL